jgi:serine/threonine-protein kinase
LDRTGAVLVDTYRIERLIAEGGMGAVYEASHLRIPKKFAIKFLKVSLLDNSVALLRFRREAEVIATLDHPHIVNLFDYNLTDDGVPYTVLEYLEGEHLGDRVTRGRLPLGEAMRIAEAVTGALTAAHDKGIVHRDLKPENVILAKGGGIKVVDFGIAKLRGGQELTAFNSILGTVTYMAPEQLVAGHIDARADQFALSAIVYEMLSGDMPFGSEGSIPEIADRVMLQQPAAITGYPQPVQEVLLRGMAKEAANRYANVDGFFRALREATGPLLDRRDRKDKSAPPPPGEVVTDVALPELPGDETSISVPPLSAEATAVSLPAVARSGEAPLPSEPTLVAASTATPTSAAIALPSEATRITQPTQPSAAVETSGRASAATGRGMSVTDRMSSVPASLSGMLFERLGHRGGIAVGVVIGVVIAVCASLLWR